MDKSMIPSLIGLAFTLVVIALGAFTIRRKNRNSDS